MSLAAGLCLAWAALAQDTAAGQQAEPPMAEPPPMPKGVEVQARGPIHEAFASPTTEPTPTKPVSKQPPKALEEMPPEEKPEGDAVWIGGYWAWDDDRKDFLWVSGIWRNVPPGKKWVAGYWREDNSQWQWVPGFWTTADQVQGDSHEVTYLPAPPAPPQVAAPGSPPNPESFYVPGTWVWNGTTYAWQAGYWARVQPGYIWVAAHYSWTPSGYVYVPGYWDMAMARRGVLYAPVVIDPVLVGPTFVYTPGYVVYDTLVMDSLFVRPCYCHYYFGDYYGPAYREYGFESCVVYSRSHYDGVFVYACYEHRAEPSWATLQVDICLARHSGQAPCPPRTFVQNNVTNNVTNVTNITNVNVYKGPTLAPASRLAAVKGVRAVPLDRTARVQAQQQSQAVQQVALQRSRTEVPVPPGRPIQPRVAKLTVPPTHPGGGVNHAAGGAAAAAGHAPSGTPGGHPQAGPVGTRQGNMPTSPLNQHPGSPNAHPPGVLPGQRPMPGTLQRPQPHPPAKPEKPHHPPPPGQG
jgi:hypothetical protein